jgi:hypothetical protein
MSALGHDRAWRALTPGFRRGAEAVISRLMRRWKVGLRSNRKDGLARRAGA